MTDTPPAADEQARADEVDDDRRFGDDLLYDDVYDDDGNLLEPVSIDDVLQAIRQP